MSMLIGAGRRDFEVGSQTVSAIVAEPVPLGDTWEDHLLAQVVAGWRPDEWDGERWIFTASPDSPRTRLSRCARPGCHITMTPKRVGLCVTCRKEGAANGWTVEETLNAPRAKAPVMRTNTRRPQCSGGPADGRCKRESLTRGVCYVHYNAVRDACGRTPTDQELTSAVAQMSAHEALDVCDVVECVHERRGPRVRFCNTHMNSLAISKRRGLTEDEWEQWVAEPFLPAFSLPLLLLPAQVRCELLLAMQRYDTERRTRFDIANWSKVFTRVREARVTTLMDRPRSDWLDASDSSSKYLWLFTLDAIETQYHAFHGLEADAYVFDTGALGIHYSQTGVQKPLAGRRTKIDLNDVTQPWLRDACAHFILTRGADAGAEKVRRVAKLAPLLSKALRDANPESDDITSLALVDMDVIVQTVNSTWSKRKTQDNYLAAWWAVESHAHDHGLWADAPTAFRRNTTRHRSDGAYRDLDECGDALPLAVVKHLARHLDLIDGGTHRGEMSPAFRALRNRTMCLVGRDTGRRPNEVVGLIRDCVVLDSDGQSWVLKWDNKKMRRPGRRLPINGDTVAAITVWQEALSEFEAEQSRARSPWLFPSPLAPENHISQETFANALKSWVRATPPLEFPVTHTDGVKRVFDLGTITLYSWRHTYAQRHVDAGTDPRTLMDLMDHRSEKSTMSYYRVGWDAKRKAQTAMADLTFDRNGQANPLAPSRVGLSEVAVPFGGCTEPSNVKALGDACPTRFKCIGCHFYRPDPSYLPAIEKHIDSLMVQESFLRANNGPTYMIDAAEAEQADWERLRDAMAESLDNLSETERDEVEMQMRLLRRARTADARGLSLALTPLASGDDGHDEDEVEA